MEKKNRCVYGVDPEKEVAPFMVRDAIVQCFFHAHCEEVGADGEGVNKNYCQEIVRKAFEDSGGDFDDPTKESIMNSMKYLAEFSKNFRDQERVQKNFNDIMSLVEKIS